MQFNKWRGSPTCLGSNELPEVIKSLWEQGYQGTMKEQSTCRKSQLSISMITTENILN